MWRQETHVLKTSVPVLISSEVNRENLLAEMRLTQQKYRLENRICRYRISHSFCLGACRLLVFSITHRVLFVRYLLFLVVLFSLLFFFVVKVLSSSKSNVFLQKVNVVFSIHVYGWGWNSWIRTLHLSSSQDGERKLFLRVESCALIQMEFCDQSGICKLLR